MTLHTDIPTRAEIDALLRTRTAPAVSLYLTTDPASKGGAERVQMGNALRDVREALRASGATDDDASAVDEQLSDLAEDIPFWRYQARSLAVFATPSSLLTFRLPNDLRPFSAVSDRFHLKPLLRAVTFPQTAFVLALTQGSVRLLEIGPGFPPEPVEVPGMPVDIASAEGRASVTSRAGTARVRGDEGQKVRMSQFARQVDLALRQALPSDGVPLILAATEPLASIYRAMCHYPDLAPTTIPGPEDLRDDELIARARDVLDRTHADRLRELDELFDQRTAQGRTATDVAEVARLATRAVVDTVLVDFESVVPGTVDDDTGAVTFEEADSTASYGVVDEIARRVWRGGGRVLAVRRPDVPGGGPVAALLRYRP